MSKKVGGLFTNLFTRSNNNLVTDAAPLDENTSESSELQRNATSIISRPFSSPETGQLQPYDNQNTSLLAQRNDSWMTNGNSLALNSTQQNIYQFSHVNGIHLGSVVSYNINNNNVEGSSDRRPKSVVKSDDPIKKTKSIDSMMKSTEPVNEQVMYHISKHLGKGWRMVARCLGFSDGQIDQMEEDHDKKGVQEVIYQMLLDYSRNNDDACLGHITKILWKHGFKECVYILKQHWKNGELYTPDTTNAGSSKVINLE